MKRVSWILILVIGFVVTFTACEDDEEPSADTPAISSITPNSGEPGTVVTIAGSTFGSSPTVNFGSTAATVSSATATSISTTVPSGLAAGAVNVSVTAGGQTSNAVSFTVEEPDIDDPAAELVLHLMDNENVIVDPEFGGVSRETDGMLDPRPSADDVTTSLASYPEDDFFTEVNYKGAFDPAAAGTWLDGWSLLSRAGYLPGSGGQAYAYNTADTAGIVITLPQAIDGDLTLESDYIYKLDGYSFVENGTLTIEPGTVIISAVTPSTGDPVSALIITRSAMIMAEGTVDEPIIFTSELDNEVENLTPTDVSLWGGLVLLGEGETLQDGATEVQIEGIPSAIPALYGGDNNEDNSGVLRYISIRYTGDEISTGNELQGLTMGGVGSGTTIEYIESFASSDDGVEIFGGAANVKYFAVAFADDDSYDFDAGWVGKGQFWFAIQADGDGDQIGEWDGAIPDAAEIYSNPTIYNGTFIAGSTAATQAIVMRDNTAGTVANSILTGPTRGIQVEDLGDSEDDSYHRLVNGEIQFLNNIWSFGDQTEFSSGDNGIITLTE